MALQWLCSGYAVFFHGFLSCQLICTGNSSQVDRIAGKALQVPQKAISSSQLQWAQKLTEFNNRSEKNIKDLADDRNGIFFTSIRFVAP